MQSSRAIQILEAKREEAQSLMTVRQGSSEFTKWQRNTEVALEKIFGQDSRNINDFKEVRYSLYMWTSDTPVSDFQAAYVRGLRHAVAILTSMIEEIQEYSDDDSDAANVPDQLNLIERICIRFHVAARQLRSRHNGRETLSIEDEYDVQDLLHSFLRLHFDDVRAEEWTPSYAGRSSRQDFLLKEERVVIEVKKTRKTLKDGDLGEELIIDRARYEQHPDCDTLICFVYDPEGWIGNPVGLERDLEKHSGQVRVRVIIAPKS